ncbi:MAG: 5-formyltetrahydrofolate cyclo-ligase [Lachnospiraceae bacterium]|nr:5-formyltetrahydrofolate cyclo-ligase [Lachnospiraceae bacterium]
MDFGQSSLIIKEKKAAVRKEMIAKRRALSKEECEEKSKIICERFLGSDEYDRADVILLYKAYNNEVDTDLIFERAVADGKKVAYPLSKITDGEPEMVFYTVNDLKSLKRGYKGILEPDTNLSKECVGKNADICITPGVAFDQSCHRIGYGKAFYDRFIRLNEPKKTIGLAYDIQMIEKIEAGVRDIALDMVITERTVYQK